MSQIFHPSMNTVAKATIFGAVFIAAAAGWVGWEVDKSPYITGAGVPRAQPVPFSHEHHVNGLGLDCRYCHTSVEVSAFAGIPPTSTCMNCHRQIWAEAPMLEPVRESFRTGKSLEWVRVHDLPDFAYFNHQAHIQRGVGCKSCPGAVDKMPLTWQVEPLTMGFCL